MVWRTDRKIVDFLPGAAQQIHMTIKPFELGEKACAGKIAVQDSNGIANIERDLQTTSDCFNRSQMARGHISRRSDETKIHE